MEKQTPSIGRIVHYQRGGEIEAAIIVKVWHEEMVNLTVFDANGNARGETSVQLGQGEGKWIWPAFVPPKKTES